MLNSINTKSKGEIPKQSGKNLFVIFFSILLTAIQLHAQDAPSLTSAIRGVVLDQHSQFPLPGVPVVLRDSNPIKGATTDANGNFRLENVPVGRQSIEVAYLGYEPQMLSNLLITSGKELEINIQLIESVTDLQVVEITAKDDKAKAQNEMSTVSTRTLNMEEAQRYSGTLQDVARMAQNYAGVGTTSDDRNDIVIRGNSPTGVLWRLEGIDVPNPNHFATLATTGGPISLLNANNLSSSDFSTSAFAAEYGNALSGVFDLKLRSGNKDKREYMAQLGFNGLEFGAEGPFKKGGQSSYIINARYSFLGILTGLGVDFGTGTAVPEYQDVTFKLDLPTEKAGRFTVFGVGGNSFIHFKPEQQGENNLYASDNEAQQFHSKTAIAGMTHTYFFSEKTFGKLTLAATTGGTEGWIDTLDFDGNPTRFFGVFQQQNELKGNYTINSKINAKHTVKGGVMYNFFDFDVEDSVRYVGNYYYKERDFEGQTGLARAFAQWQYRPTDLWTINTGVYSQHFLYNSTTSVEPRIGARYALTEKQSLSFGAGMHSQLQPIVVYFNREEDDLGNTLANNKELDFNKAVHGVIGYDNQLGKNLRLKTELYYQYLYDIAVDRLPSTFSILNTGADFVMPNKGDLMNEGTGTNYGIELTLERFLDRGFYFLFTTSLFDSKYKGSDGVERNSAFNGNYVFNLLAGKEWKVGKSNAVTLDFKTTYAGGRRFTPILLEESIAQEEEVRDEANAFADQYKAYVRTDFKIGFRMNRPKYSQAISLDIRNVTNEQNVFIQNFDSRSGEIETVYQTGFFPIVVWNIWF
ncbi:MAG: TonB-dependent receptor [Flavobacteriales bacterium]|nr:TonB-dependent receptor [Flavobacteriales bacterium]